MRSIQAVAQRWPLGAARAPLGRQSWGRRARRAGTQTFILAAVLKAGLWAGAFLAAAVTALVG
jgi:hypothetical protein